MNDSIEQRFQAQLAAGNLALPVLPAVGAEVMSLARSEDSDASQLAQLIQNDLALSSHVMRMANSAAYSPAGKIQTLQQAITKLGMRQIAQMALTVSVGETVFKASDTTEKIIEYLWRHALASAAWAREIARIHRSNTEIAFLCGLLHQIGKPVTINAMTEMLEEEVVQQEEQLAIVEMLDTFNKPVGTALAEQWQFPGAVADSINYTDKYEEAPSSRQEAMIVNAANYLATSMLGEGPLMIDDLQRQPVFAALNFYDDDLEMLLEKESVIQSLIETLRL